MRILVRSIARQADFGEHRLHRRTNLAFRAQAVDVHRLAQRSTDRAARIERRIGILEHDLHLPAQRTHATSVCRENVLTSKQDGAGIRFDQPQDGAPGSGLSATGFADEPERLARRDRERDVGERVHERSLAAHEAAAGDKSLHEIADVEQRSACMIPPRLRLSPLRCPPGGGIRALGRPGGAHGVCPPSPARTQQRTW